MGLFSSQKNSTTENKTTNNYADNRSVIDAGGGVVGSGNVLNITDGETSRAALAFAAGTQEGVSGFNLAALERTFNMAGLAAANSQKSSGELLGFAREAVGGATAAVGEAYKTATDTGSGNRTLILAGLAVVGVAAAVFLFKR